MPSKVTIVVSRIHWQCVSCRLVNTHMVSIDQHLKTSHQNLLSLPPVVLSCPPDCDGGLNEEKHDSSSQFSRKYFCGESCNSPAKSVKLGPFEAVAEEKSVNENKTENSPRNRGTNHTSTHGIDCVTVGLSWSGQAPHKKRKCVLAAESQKQTKPGWREQHIPDAENLTAKRGRRKRQHEDQSSRNITCKKKDLSKCSDGQSKGDGFVEKDNSSSAIATETQEGDEMKLPAEVADIDAEDNTEKDHVTRMTTSVLKGSRALKSRNKSCRTRPESNRKILDEAAKKPLSGGKLIKRTKDIPEKEMNRLKIDYIGLQAQSHTDATRAASTATCTTIEKSLSLGSVCNKESFGSHLTATEVNNAQKVMQENKEGLFTSWTDSVHEIIQPQGIRDIPPLGRPTCAMTNSTQLSQTLTDSESQFETSENKVPYSSQAEKRYNQKAVIKTMQNEHTEEVDHFPTPESDDWVKSNTKFNFAKTKLAVSFKEPSNIHTCTVCEARFSDGRLLSDHLLKKSSHSPLQCEVCQKSFHSIYNLNLHVFGHHEKRSKPFCFECGEKFHSMETFEKHLHQHICVQDLHLLDMEYHSCKVCKCDLPCSYDTLRKHYHNKHKVTVCLECFIRSSLVLMSDAASVKMHRKVHENFCKICIQDFPSSESLQSHYLSHSDCQHEEDGHGKLCERCNHWCPNKALAVLHQREHRLQVMRNWRVEKWGLGIACLYCDKVLRNKRNLQRHITQLHSSCRTYKFHCEFCGKGVDSKNNLKDHIAFHHLGIKRYICEFCREGFACGPTLRRHILKEHAKDKQYACEVCGEKFCEKFGLTKHMYIHTGSARFMCDQCGKGFHFSSEFKKHLSVHVEKREFVCHVCGQGYKRKEHLKRHAQKCAKPVKID